MTDYHLTELKRWASLGPMVEVSDKNFGPGISNTPAEVYVPPSQRPYSRMFLFKTTLKDIIRRTNELHAYFNSVKDPYSSQKETACASWGLRALGLIQDITLVKCRKFQRAQPYGTYNYQLTSYIEEYLNKNSLQYEDYHYVVKTGRMNILDVFTYMKPNTATIIFIRFKNDSIATEMESMWDTSEIDEKDFGHYILAVYTTDKVRLLYDPSEMKEEYRIYWSAEDSYNYRASLRQRMIELNITNTIDVFYTKELFDPSEQIAKTKLDTKTTVFGGATLYGGRKNIRRTLRRKTIKRKTIKRRKFM